MPDASQIHRPGPTRPRAHRARRVAAWRCAGALLASLLAAGIIASSALADGDPASDVLVSQVAFVPSDAGASARQQAELVRTIDASDRAGYQVRVAIIPDGYDLGSVTALWAKPRAYAEFLGIELSYIHKQPLLVVMPDGIGFYWQGHSAASANRQLAGISTRTANAGLLTAAQTAVRTLATSAGFHLASQPRSGGAGAPAVEGESRSRS